jgi:hypothetical protein
MLDRCPNCDKEACDLDAAQIAYGNCDCPTLWCEHRKRLMDAENHCTTNTVNWRTRAKEAEAKLDELRGSLAVTFAGTVSEESMKMWHEQGLQVVFQPTPPEGE